MAELVRTYADLPLGAVDAPVLAVAERLRLTDVATLDRRHFTIVRPSHTHALNLLPQEASRQARIQATIHCADPGSRSHGRRSKAHAGARNGPALRRARPAVPRGILISAR
jgi:hypothetical protein